MSFALDANVLLYASNAACREHEPAKAFLERCALGTELMCLPWPAVMGYLRIATHPSVFPNPLSWREASSNVDYLLELRHVRLLGELDGFWKDFRFVCEEVPARGNQVPDAQIAALLRQHGVSTLYTRDRDFRRYDFLELRDPFGG